ncbi:MAG: lipopolysaccharide kinase InaA family protein [Rikenellaceae bacterium]
MIKTRILVSSEYQHLEKFVEALPRIFESEGTTIWRKRNEVKVFEVEGVRINVKRYCIPPFFFNRIVYLLFRRPKAVRAYEFATLLLSKEIDTPAPIAYSVARKGLLMWYSYFVSLHLDDITSVGELCEKGLDEPCRDILTSLGRYTASLHDKGIYHKDYSSVNILYHPLAEQPQFCLVDINRMRFGEVTMEQGCTNLERLNCTEEMLTIVAQSYATARGFNPDECVQIALKAQAAYATKQRRKHR